MQVRFDHDSTKQEARGKAERLMTQVESRYGKFVSDVDHSWSGDVLSFSFRAQGMKVNGTVELTETEVIVTGHLPLLAKPFEPKIAKMIEGEGKNIFRTV